MSPSNRMEVDISEASPDSRNRIKKWIWRLAFVALILIFGPYLFSRFTAAQNRLVLVEGDTVVRSNGSGTLRIVCYNIAHGRGLTKSNWTGENANERTDRMDQIADLLVELDADVVVLNEIDFDTSWSNNVNQAKYLAEKCGYPFRLEERNLDFRVLHRTWRFGNAILSKLPLSNPSLIDLPSYQGIETLLAGKKRAAGADVILDGRKIHIVAAHLSHRSEEIREASARRIIKHVRSLKIPTIVAGDMNSTPRHYPGYKVTGEGKNAIETFRNSGLFKLSQRWAPEFDEELTFASDDPQAVIDWFLFTKELDDQVTYDVIDSKLSDHRPVVADFSFETEKKSETRQTKELQNQ